MDGKCTSTPAASMSILMFVFAIFIESYFIVSVLFSKSNEKVSGRIPS